MFSLNIHRVLPQLIRLRFLIVLSHHSFVWLTVQSSQMLHSQSWRGPKKQDIISSKIYIVCISFKCQMKRCAHFTLFPHHYSTFNSNRVSFICLYHTWQWGHFGSLYSALIKGWNMPQTVYTSSCEGCRVTPSEQIMLKMMCQSWKLKCRLYEYQYSEIKVVAEKILSESEMLDLWVSDYRGTTVFDIALIPCPAKEGLSRAHKCSCKRGESVQADNLI